MKSIVVYFSLTGSTKLVADAIWKGVKAANGQCDLARIQDLSMGDLSQYDLVGLGCPVWGFTEPPNVTNFLWYMPTMPNSHAFLFATHGSDRGMVFRTMSSVLERKKLTVVGYKSWYGNVWMQMYAMPFPTNGHPDEIDLREAFDYGMEMVETSRKVRGGATDLMPVRGGTDRQG